MASAIDVELTDGLVGHAAEDHDLADAPQPRPKSPGVRADDDLAEAGRKVLRFHLGRMLDHEPGTRLGEDPEELHDMRVATRRSRAAWRVFGPAFEAKPTKRYVKRLRQLGTLLGRVRDLDVLLEATEGYQAGLAEDERAGLAPMLAAWRADRDEARIPMIAGLDFDLVPGVGGGVSRVYGD